MFKRDGQTAFFDIFASSQQIGANRSGRCLPTIYTFEQTLFYHNILAYSERFNCISAYSHSPLSAEKLLLSNPVEAQVGKETSIIRSRTDHRKYGLVSRSGPH